MKLFLCILFLFSGKIQASDKLPLNGSGLEIEKIVEMYSKASGKAFILDPGVRGKISIFNKDEISLDEYYNQMSSALAVNGYAISKQGDTYLIKSARNIQRDLIEIQTDLPALKPERMVSFVYTFKHLSASTINRDLRILLSKDGELVVNQSKNQIIITDWVSNIHRVNELFSKIDQPNTEEVQKIVEKFKQEKEEKKSITK